MKLLLGPGMEVSPVAALAMLEIPQNLFKAEIALPWINIFFCVQSWSWILLFPIYFQTFRTRSNQLKVFSNLFKRQRAENTEGRNSYLYFCSLVPWDSNVLGLPVLYQLPFSLTLRKQRLNLRSALSGLFLPEKYTACTSSSQRLSFTFLVADWLYG